MDLTLAAPMDESAIKSIMTIKHNMEHRVDMLGHVRECPN